MQQQLAAQVRSALLLQQGQNQSPHRSHADPWAHDFICCDTTHAASTSHPSSTPSSFTGINGGYSGSNGTSPITGTFPYTKPLSFPAPAMPSVPSSRAQRPMEQVHIGNSHGCNDDGCCTEPTCGPVECCTDPSCAAEGCDETHQHTHRGKGMGVTDGSTDEELIKWACSEEGCEAIQQFMKSCTLPDCHLPAISPSDNGAAAESTMGITPHYHLVNTLDPAIGSDALQPGLHLNSVNLLPRQLGQQQQAQSQLAGNDLLSQITALGNGMDLNFGSGSSSRPGSSHLHQSPTLLNHIHQHLHQHQTTRHNHQPFHSLQQSSQSHFPIRNHRQHTHSHSHSHPHTPNHHGQQHQQMSNFHNHRGHSHSTSITSLPQSNMTSPDILPWSSGITTPAGSTPQTNSLHSPAHALQFPTHVCHWQNCHLTFSSMPDLLAHVAADHLGAPGFGPSNPLPNQHSIAMNQLQNQYAGGLGLQSSQLQQQLHSSSQPQLLSQSLQFDPTSSSSSSMLPSLPIASTTTSTPSTSSLPDLSALGFHPSQSQAEQDRLLSCLWDSCFPLPTECSADQPSHCPPHVNIPSPGDCTVSHPHSHTHTHLDANGAHQPFSPQTMLRHVLEEHLGVPGDILGWGNFEQEFGMESLAAGLMGNTGGVGVGNGLGQLELPPSAMEITNAKETIQSTTSSSSASGSASGSGSGSGVILHTPPSSTNTSRLPSPPPSKPLICHWKNCTHSSPFNSPLELMDHLSEHHLGKGKDSYVCLWGDCLGPTGEGRLFRSRQKILRHLQSHTGYRPFICPVCQQAFSEAAPLQAHLRRHKEEKPFICDEPGCGKRFAISSSLTIHMRTHNGEKPFICPHCQKGFVEASNLTKHIRTHTGERPFACLHPGCDKRFPRPDQLKRHMGVHERKKVVGGRERGEGMSKGSGKG